MAAESTPTTAASVTTADGPPSDADLREWLDSLPCTYHRIVDRRRGRVTDRIMLTYYGNGFAVPQNLAETMQRHGYMFRQAAPKMLVFQRVGGKPA